MNSAIDAVADEQVDDMPKTPGQIAYEEDVRRKPLYNNGAPRRHWLDLRAEFRQSWEDDPTPRDWKKS